MPILNDDDDSKYTGNLITSTELAVEDFDVDWQKIPTLDDLKQEYTGAESAASGHFSLVNSWIENYDVTGKAQVKSDKKKSTIVLKLIRKHAEWQKPALSEPFLSTDKVIQVNPITFEDKDRAIQNEMILNNQFNCKINFVKFINNYVGSAVKIGTSIVKTSWVYRTEEVTEDKLVFQYVPIVPDEDYLNNFNNLQYLKENHPDSYNQIDETIRKGFEYSVKYNTYAIAEVVRVDTVTYDKVVENRPELEVCNLKDVLIDPTCKGDFSKANFVIHEFESSLAQLKKDGRYKNLDKIELSSSGSLNSSGVYGDEKQLSGFRYSGKTRQKIIVKEYWGFYDIYDTGILQPIIIAWCGDVIIRMADNPYPDKQLPFVVVPLIPIDDSVYGEPSGALLEDNQKVQSALTRGILDTVGNVAAGQRGFSKQFLDTVNKNKFLAGQDYEFNPQTDPRTHVHTHTFPEVPQAALVLMQLFNSDAESLTGVKAFSSGGISGENLGKTAQGDSSAMDDAIKREMSILRKLADGILQIARKMLAMNAEFLEEEEVVRITNSKFVTVRRDDLPGNYDLTINISTPESDNLKAEELAYMLQTMGNNINPEMSQMILSEIARLRNMPDLAEKIKNYQPQPDPLQQENLQLQNELLKAQIRATLAGAEEAGTKAVLNSAKVDTEGAKAQHVQNTADKIAQDSYADFSGIKHGREMEKLASTAGANLASQTIKADTEIAKASIAAAIQKGKQNAKDTQ